MPRSPQVIVAEICATCHGPKLTGSVGPNLLDGWANYGQDPASDRRNIRDGWPATGMPAFRNVLSEPELDALVDYLAFQRKEMIAGRVTPPIPPNRIDVVSEQHAFTVEMCVEGLGMAWGLAFLPEGRALVTEREGRLRLLVNGQLDPTPIAGIPHVFARQDGGLLDVAVHPDYAANGWIYLSFSEPGVAPNTSMTKIVRGRIVDHRWTDQQVIFGVGQEHYVTGASHYGCRLFFDGRGHLYFGIGDRGFAERAQDLTSPFGKIHRIRDDGTAPSDNPFLDQPSAMPSIWSYGHRHNQGFGFDADGNLWATEHGPTGGDELNRIQRGGNYGWPLTSAGTDSGKPYAVSHGDTIAPEVAWSPAIAPSPLLRYDGELFPEWRGNLLVGCLGGEQLRRIVVRDGHVTHEEVLFRGMGRVRDIVPGPDGNLYLVMNNPGRILKMMKASGVHAPAGTKPAL